MSTGLLDREQMGDILDALDFAIDEMDYIYFDERNPWRADIEDAGLWKQFHAWKEVREVVVAMYNQAEPRTEKESQCPQA